MKINAGQNTRSKSTSSSGGRPVMPPFNIIPIPIFWALLIDAVDLLKAPLTTVTQFLGIGVAINVVVAFIQGIMATYIFADPIMLLVIAEGGVPSPLDVWPTVTTILLLETAASKALNRNSNSDSQFVRLFNRSG